MNKRNKFKRDRKQFLSSPVTTSLCIFCGKKLSPGSEEHVFMSALGGRLTSRQATCTKCNNSFSNKNTGAPEDKFAESLILIRNALKISTGRDGPPPTIKDAGLIDGKSYDLAPGFSPVFPRAKIPPKESIKAGDEIGFSLHDVKDKRRVLDIFSKRGQPSTITKMEKVARQAPTSNFTLNIPLSIAHRVIAKTAVVGACLLYGNVNARGNFNNRLLLAIQSRRNTTDSFSKIDFSNNWPTILEMKPHSKAPSSTRSGFEHSMVIADVGRNWVAYLTLFGHIRFTVRLGKRSGLPIRGLAINPRANTLERFEISAMAPSSYRGFSLKKYRKEYAKTVAEFAQSMEKILETWRRESINDYSKSLADELLDQLSLVAHDETKFNETIHRWAEKLAFIQSGGTWRESIHDTE